MAKVAQHPVMRDFLISDDSICLPIETLKELHKINLAYPGWESDFLEVCQAYESGNDELFQASYKKLLEKQRVYDNYRAFNRISALKTVALTYPGHELDIEEVEEWHLKNPPSEENDLFFQEMLEGLSNKEQLFNSDRSHPNIVALDQVELSYPKWEEDYQFAIAAHCKSPLRLFPDALHALCEKQLVHDGDRSHWRLVALDNLRLTYPGWKADFKEIEEWHFQNHDNEATRSMFYEVLEGMKDQEMIFLGWDHTEEASDAESTVDSSHCLMDDNSTVVTDASGSTTAQVSFYKLKDEAGPIKEYYQSIKASLEKHEAQKKKLAEQRLHIGPLSTSQSQRTAQHTRREGPPEDSLAPLDLGKCVVCLTRPKTHVFVPCGHLCACAACSNRAIETRGQCPICRRDADLAQRIFLV